MEVGIVTQWIGETVRKHQSAEQTDVCPRNPCQNRQGRTKSKPSSAVTNHKGPLQSKTEGIPSRNKQKKTQASLLAVLVQQNYSAAAVPSCSRI